MFQRVEGKAGGCLAGVKNVFRGSVLRKSPQQGGNGRQHQCVADVHITRLNIGGRLFKGEVTVSLKHASITHNQTD